MDAIEQALPVVELKLGGEKHQIVCSFEVLYRFQMLTISPEHPDGLNPFDAAVLANMSPVRCCQLVACCLYEEPAEHMKEVSKKLGACHAVKIGELITKLLKISLPVNEEGSEEGEEKKA